MIWYSLRSKLALAFSLVAVALVTLAVLAVTELRALEERIAVERTTTALFDRVREVRNHENRLFLFRKAADYRELQTEITGALEFIDAWRARLASVAGEPALVGLREALIDYREQTRAYWRDERRRTRADSTAEERIRDGRRSFIDIAESLSVSAQGAVQAGLAGHRRSLAAGIAALVLLMVFVAHFLTRKIVRPLKSIECQMEQVADGAIGRVGFSSQDQELVSLGKAFNHVMSELEQRQKAAAQAERLASLGTMLSGVAHELNNPLSNISTTVQIIGEEVEQLSTAELSRFLERIDLQTERARAIVRALLDYARADAGQPAPIDVGAVVDQAVEAINHGRAFPRRILTDIASPLTVVGSGERLQRVLINLLGNAIDATADDEPIVVAARALPNSVASPRIEICVQDCGAGMTGEQIERMFDPFYTTKPVGQGTGLGLFIAHEIVKQHGGSIRVLSRPGTGTSVEVRLPASMEAVADER